MSEYKLWPRLVHARIVAKAHPFERLVEGPAGKDLGDFSDISLRVSTIHTECVQFEQLAPVVFVKAAARLASGLRLLPWRTLPAVWAATIRTATHWTAAHHRPSRA